MFYVLVFKVSILYLYKRGDINYNRIQSSSTNVYCVMHTVRSGTIQHPYCYIFMLHADSNYVRRDYKERFVFVCMYVVPCHVVFPYTFPLKTLCVGYTTNTKKELRTCST